jgi:hypothetical protein
VADYGGDGSLCAGDRVPNAGVEFTGGKFERLLDPLKSGRALALGIGVGDLRRIRARLPHADVIELRGASGMLGTELEGGAAAGHHSVGSEFPAAAAVNAATAAAAAAAFSAAGALRTYGPPPSVSAGGPAPRIALLTAELAGLFGGENRIIVIRPDGYLGFRGSLEDLARLDDYARLTALS